MYLEIIDYLIIFQISCNQIISRSPSHKSFQQVSLHRCLAVIYKIENLLLLLILKKLTNKSKNLN